MRRRGRLIATTVLVAAVLAVLLVFGLSSSGKGEVGRKAPGLPRERLAGPAVTLPGAVASARGKATLVTFWASWCGPCAREAGALERFAQSPAGRGRLIAVDWSDELPGARKFVADHGWTFPVLRDTEGTVGNDYRLTGLPTTYVIDGEGRIGSVLRGPQTQATLARALQGVKRS
ncbi:MAG TPA: TlpA disulfide reductase family protein [Solirubrobacteraceae bacterium]|nr:TlpA disulfide reductase family protein [Solirubrobacteraceae bacterium]